MAEIEELKGVALSWMVEAVAEEKVPVACPMPYFLFK